MATDRTSASPADLRQVLRRAAAAADDALVAGWLSALAERGESAALGVHADVGDQAPPGKRAAAAKPDLTRG
jgi:hypothetical protein